MNKSGTIKCPACSSILKISELKAKDVDTGVQVFCKHCKNKLLIKEKEVNISNKSCIKKIVSVLY